MRIRYMTLPIEIVNGEPLTPYLLIIDQVTQEGLANTRPLDLSAGLDARGVLVFASDVEIGESKS